MIRVTFYYEPQGSYTSFTALGHAGYAAPDEPDILCAAITALTTGTIGALQDEAKIPLRYCAEEGEITCQVNWSELDSIQQDHADLLLRSLRLACQQIEATYGETYVSVSVQPEHKEEFKL